jgi:hypothetical protein
MREQATKLLAFVALLLSGVCIFFGYGGQVLAAAQPDMTIQVFLPIVHIRAPQSASDLQIVHMGLYQSVQSQSNDVTLVAHKPAMLRVYALSAASSGPILADVTIVAKRDGRRIGSLSISPQTVSSTPTADNLDSTFNFDLPIEWLSGEITLTATIDDRDLVNEANETNNSIQSVFSFQDVPSLNLTIVPIHYVDVVTGVVFAEPGHDPISEWLLSAFPLSDINVSIHTPITFSGDLRQGAEWVRLLDQLTALWTAEIGAGSSHVYFGLVPNRGLGGESWFEGGVSGYGWIGQRVSLALDVGEETGPAAGHELGHNFGRNHAPCGNPSDIDPHFPYPNASIGVYGVDISDEILLDPALTRDMMSYCGPEWVSDYTYEGLLHELLRQNGRAASGEGLLLRASMNGDTITSQTAYHVERAYLSNRSGGDYQVKLLDGAGELIGVYPAELYVAEEMGVSAKMLLAFAPGISEAEVGQVQILNNDRLIAERAMSEIREKQ